MAKGAKRAAPQTQKAKQSKKAKFQPQPVPESDSGSENDATIYQSAEDASSSDISDSSDDVLDNDSESDELDSDKETGKYSDNESEKYELDSEKDELDSASEDELDMNDETEETTTTSSDPNKKSSAEQHAEQKKLLSERKLKRKAGVEVERIKSVWERLRVKRPAPPKAVREKLCNEIWDLSKDCIYDLVLKHDASRVVQTLVKYTTKERRDIVVQALKGHYYNLATSSYGKYLLIKLLHYGSKESRALIVDELHGKLRKLMRHKEGAYVVEDLYVLYSSAQQKQQMIREFWGSEFAIFKDSGKDKSVLDVVNESAEKRSLIMKNLSSTIEASVNKGSTGFQILHAAMKEYVTILAEDVEKNDQQIRELVELLGEQVAELVHTQEGSEVASSIIAFANAKERKTIVRCLKPHADKLIRDEHGNSVLITLFMTVDDTVMVHRAFSAELFTPEIMPGLVQEKFSRRPLLYLLKGLDGKYFAPKNRDDFLRYEKLAYAKTSKKPQDQRRAELQSRALPLIYSSLLASADPASDPTLTQLLSVNVAAQFIAELCLTPSDEEEVNSTLRPQLVDAIFDITFATDILEDFHLLNKTPFFSRSLKALIQGNGFKWDNSAKKLVAVENSDVPYVGKEFAVKIADALLEDDTLEKWVTGQGTFVVLSVYEVLALSDTGKAKKLHKALKSLKKIMTKDSDNKGAQLLVAAL